MKKTTETIWNAANILTILRIVLIPVYIVMYGKGYRNGAMIVFLLASLTDFLDGRIARKYNLVTNFGKFMDPLADKLMCLTVLLSLVSSGMVQWIPVVLITTKELFMLAGGTYLLGKGIVVQSRMIGKAAQWLLITALCMGFFHNFFTRWILPLDVIFLWIAVIVSLLASVFYTAAVFKMADKQKVKKEL